VIVALEVVVLVALGLLAVFGLVITILNRPPDRTAKLAVGVAVALLVVQAAIAAVRVFTGVQLAETSTFLIYLAVSIGVLPIATQFATATDETTGDGPTRWGGTVIAVGAIATAVAVIRLQYLWDARV
jgi:VanZ family protein